MTVGKELLRGLEPDRYRRVRLGGRHVVERGQVAIDREERRLKIGFVDLFNGLLLVAGCAVGGIADMFEVAED